MSISNDTLVPPASPCVILVWLSSPPPPQECHVLFEWPLSGYEIFKKYDELKQACQTQIH